MVICCWATWILLGAFAGRFSITDSVVGLVLAASGVIPALIYFAATRRNDGLFFAFFPVMFARDYAGDKGLAAYFIAWTCSTFGVLVVVLGIRVFSRRQAKMPPDAST
jgi:hypothetical protein